MRDLKSEIRHEAMRRMERIEEIYSNGLTVPPEVMSLYGMLTAVASDSIGRYFDNFGYREIDTGDINDAKQDLNWAPITDFEREVIALINEHCRQRQYSLRVSQPIAADVRAST